MPAENAIDTKPTVANADPKIQKSEFSLIEGAKQVVLSVPTTDGKNNPLAVNSVEQPKNGVVTIGPNGTLFYTPNHGFNRADSFSYTVLDASGNPSDAAVQLSVLPGHSQPQNKLNDKIAPMIEASEYSLILKKVAEIPKEPLKALAPRMNGALTHDGNLYLWTEGSVNGEGRIYKLTDDGAGGYGVEEWFNLGAAVQENTGRALNNANFQHGGLRSVAFHPDFKNNGRFYTSIMEDRPKKEELGRHTYLSNPEKPIKADSVVVEWTVDLKTGKVDPNSYREVVRVGMPVYDHPIKGMTFNPYAKPGDADYGLLYIAHGDASVQSAIVGGGQNNDALGKILRIDPLPHEGKPYGIPNGNPFVNDPDMLDEVFASGFRNPHNLSFNQADDGKVHLVVTDIGRNNFDEINIVEAGGNYGWSKREGPLAHLEGGGAVKGVAVLPEEEVPLEFTYPSAFIGHDGNGQALAGSFVPDNGGELDGQFIFGDFTKGRIYTTSLKDLLAADRRIEKGETPKDGLSWAASYELQIYLDDDGDPKTLPVAFDSFNKMIGKKRSDFRFAKGPDGELLIVNKQDGNVYVAANTLPKDHPFFQSLPEVGVTEKVAVADARPVFLDLNRDGVVAPATLPSSEAESASDQSAAGNGDGGVPRFDWNGDGAPDQTAWVGPKDGMLVIDLAADGSAGADGKIDQAQEIAFSLWKTEDERQAELREKGIDDTGRPITDLEGLRYAFDTNRDNILDARDARWNEFRVWQDADRNGIVGKGELLTMSEAGIKLLELMPSKEGARQFADGSAITGTSTARMTDGTKMLVGDVTLAYRPKLAS